MIIDDNLKLVAFREICYFWSLVFSLFLNDISNYGIVPLIFFLMEIGRAFLHQNRMHFITATAYMIISESICLSMGTDEAIYLLFQMIVLETDVMELSMYTIQLKHQYPLE